MRNLKRALSLALATVMTMGMMVVGASASYPDVDSSYHQEAIDVTQAVGIFEGDENGNFNPDNGVTRNEMAVVMVKLLGLTTGSSSTPFTDVPSWAAPYVAACYNNGIIAGTSDTTFSGDSTVTAAQAGLMVMKALGYFGYTGEFGQDWKVAVAKKAAEIQLYADMETYVDEALTRDKVAQLVLNALESDVMIVKEENGVSVSTGDVSVNVTPTYRESNVTNTDYDYQNRLTTTTGGSTQQLCEKLYGTKLKLANSNTTDDLGRPASKWTYEGTTITSPDSPKATYYTKVTAKQIYNDLNLTSNKSATVYINGKDAYQPKSIQKSTADSDKIGRDGLITEAYLNDNTGVVTLVQYSEFLVKTTTSYNSSTEKITVSTKTGLAGLPAEIKAEDFPIVEGLAKDEYLIVTAAQNSGDWTYQSVQKATKVSDVTISEYKTGSYAIADGTKYTYDWYAVNEDTLVLGQDQLTGTISGLNSSKYDLYLGSNGYVLGIDASDASVDLSQYLFVTKVDSTANRLTNQAKVMFMDGTTATIEVNKVAGYNGSLTSVTTAYDVTSDTTGISYPQNGVLMAGFFYTYSKTSSGTYNLTAVDPTNYALGTGLTSTTKSTPVTGLATAYIATNDSVFIADETMYTGLKNIPTVTAATYVLGNDNGYIRAAYTAGSGVSTASANDYIYVIKYDGQGVDSKGNDYYKYVVVQDGEKVTITSNTPNSSGMPGLYQVGTYSDGYPQLDTKISADTARVGYKTGIASTLIDYKNGSLKINSAAYTLKSDALVYIVDATDDNALTVVYDFDQLSGLNTGNYTVYVVTESASDSDIAVVALVRNTNT